MSLSKYQGKLAKDSSELEDGEPVLIFHGLKMRKGQSISVAVEDRKVKYLVRYPSGTGVRPIIVTYPPYAQTRYASRSQGRASGSASTSAQEPENIASSSKAKASTSRAGPGSNRTSKTGPSTSKAGPSTSLASPSSVGPSTSGGGQSSGGTSSSPVGGAIVQGASSGKSRSRMAQGASTSGPQSPSDEEQSCASVSDWDYEWIPENRVLRYSRAQLKQDNDTAIQMATRRKQKRGASGTGGSRAATYDGSDMGDQNDPGEGSSSAMMQPPEKRSRERVRSSGSRPWGSRGDAGDPKKGSASRFEIQVKLPGSLRSLLLQDWELVTLGKKLCNLPAKISVDAILSEYAICPLNCRTRDKRYAVSGLVAVIQEYFNVILSTQLLYEFERPQYAELVISYPSSQMSQIYGGAHLLRLFQQLGPMLACTPLNDSSLIILQSHLQDFLEYLSGNPSLLFIDPSDYQLASDEYLKVAI